MRPLLVCFFLILVNWMSPFYAKAQIAQRIDTVHIGGIQPGIRLADLTRHVHARIDTMIWTGPEGANLLKYSSEFHGLTGEVRVATKTYEVSQVTFVLSCKDSTSTFEKFKALERKLTNDLGQPDDRYENVFRISKWKGKHQTLALKTSEQAHYVSVVLSEAEITSKADPANAPQELRPTRQRTKR